MYDLHVRQTIKTTYHCVVNYGVLHELPICCIKLDQNYSYTQHLIYLHDGTARGGFRVSLGGLLGRDLGAASPARVGCRLWRYGVTKGWTRRCCAIKYR